jgi:dienelactone hydrolase
MHRLMLILLTVLFFASAHAEIKGEEVTYESDGIKLQGYLAYDTSTKDKRPGVLVVHEWWGHNEYARKRARMLAGLGYTALAVDMYGDGKQADHPEDAAAFSSEVAKDFPKAKARFMAAMEVLMKHTSVDAGRIGAIGYCFGGSVVLNMARAGVDLKGVVSFHGVLSPASPAKPGVVKARVLVCHGAADTFTPQNDIDDFRKEMKDAKVDLVFKEYADAKHSFTNPEADEKAEKFGMGLAYNEKADKQSWNDMKDFLKETFRKK